MKNEIYEFEIDKNKILFQTHPFDFSFSIFNNELNFKCKTREISISEIRAKS